ncbi:hypothetical protein [Sporolactobacillus vineae]|uniref:hypothetical protein n=1 Tax=Sporolactobacillus vineae TaxID=444463 RepID=UPI0002FF944B|nr:hypothetical protein [Sporolactobacillus vineae]
MKKVLRYIAFFIGAFLVQWIWYTLVTPGKPYSFLQLLMTSVVFVVILYLLDLMPKKR